jgi:hypothetical protein
MNTSVLKVARMTSQSVTRGKGKIVRYQIVSRFMGHINWAFMVISAGSGVECLEG